MSRSAATADSSAAVRTVGAIAFVLAMSIVVLLLVNARPAPDPFDPRSGRPDGARGVVVTLREVGASVSIAREVPADASGVRLLVLDDRLDDDQRAALLDAVERGAVAVVADPDSTLHGGAGVDGGATEISGGELVDGRRVDATLEANLFPGDCTIGALAALRGLVVPDGVLFPLGPDEPRCFTGRPADPGSAAAVTSFVVVRAIGEGTVIGLGDNEPFQNRWLRGADNAALLVALLAPEPGAEVVVLLGSGANRTIEDVGGGDESLRDLVPAWAWMAMILGAIAFVLFASSRAVRLGRVLSEPVVTPIDGSELVAASGNLMERAGHAPVAAQRLQHRLHRDLCLAFNVPSDAPLTRLDDVVSARADLPSGEVERVLLLTARSDDELVAVAGAVRRIRVAASTVADHGPADRSGPDPQRPLDEPHAPPSRHQHHDPHSQEVPTP